NPAATMQNSQKHKAALKDTGDSRNRITCLPGTIIVAPVTRETTRTSRQNMPNTVATTGPDNTGPKGPEFMIPLLSLNTEIQPPGRSNALNTREIRNGGPVGSSAPVQPDLIAGGLQAPADEKPLPLTTTDKHSSRRKPGARLTRHGAMGRPS